eukprot:g32129.t1
MLTAPAPEPKATAPAPAKAAKPKEEEDLSAFLPKVGATDDEGDKDLMSRIWAAEAAEEAPKKPEPEPVRRPDPPRHPQAVDVHPSAPVQGRT